MDPSRQEALRSTNAALGNQLEQLIDAVEQERSRLSEAYRELETYCLQCVSPDRSVEVTVDAGGVLTDLSLTAYAMRKSPEQLARSILELVQTAAHHAKEHSETMAVPDEVAMGDLPEFLSGAAELTDIRSYLRSNGSSAD